MKVDHFGLVAEENGVTRFVRDGQNFAHGTTAFEPTATHIQLTLGTGLDTFGLLALPRRIICLPKYQLTADD